MPEHYEKMKDSGVPWIGEIPEGWEIVRLRGIIENSTDGIKIGPFGSALYGKTQASAKYKVYGQSNIITRSFATTKHTVSEEVFKELRVYEVRPQDICISMMGTIGKCLAVPENVAAGIMDSHLIKIRLSLNMLNKYFEYLYDKDLGGICFENIMFDKKGSIMDGLNTSIVKNLLVILPPITAQLSIISYLDSACAKIDDVINEAKISIDKYRFLKKSIITHTVTKGLDPDAPMKDSGLPWIGKIPQTWEIRRLRTICKLYPYTDTSHLTDQDTITFLPMENIKNGYYIENEKKIVEYSQSYNIFQNGDILLAKVTPCFENGNIVIADNLTNGIGFGTSEIFVIRAFDVDNKFLFYYFQNIIFMQRAISTMTGAGGLKRVSINFICDEKIAFPTFLEQQEISSYLDSKCAAVDAVIKEKENLIERLEAYKKSLIFEVVTGKRKVM